MKRSHPDSEPLFNILVRPFRGNRAALMFAGGSSGAVLGFMIFNLFAILPDIPKGMNAVPAVWWFVPLSSLVALGVALYFFGWMEMEEEGNDDMKRIAGHVRDGAMAYLREQYRVVGIVFATLFVVFVLLAIIGIQNMFVPVAFLTGGFFSGLCGYIGMRTATLASARTAHGA